MTIEDPTLIMRVQTGDRAWGSSCFTAADHVVAGQFSGATVLDAQWSHEPTKWRERGNGWPRMRKTSAEKAMVDAATILTEHGAAVPQTIVKELLNIIERVSK